MAVYELKADDRTVWVGQARPSQTQIDRAAVEATARGWNGTVMNLYRSNRWAAFCYPSDEALA
jgi:hypothetical protein